MPQHKEGLGTWGSLALSSPGSTSSTQLRRAQTQGQGPAKLAAQQSRMGSGSPGQRGAGKGAGQSQGDLVGKGLSRGKSAAPGVGGSGLEWHQGGRPGQPEEHVVQDSWDWGSVCWSATGSTPADPLGAANPQGPIKSDAINHHSQSLQKPPAQARPHSLHPCTAPAGSQIRAPALGAAHPTGRGLEAGLGTKPSVCRAWTAALSPLLPGACQCLAGPAATQGDVWGLYKRSRRLAVLSSCQDNLSQAHRGTMLLGQG